MLMHLKRKLFLSGCTVGELSINGAFECYTLEDAVRERKGEPVERWKIPGQTAIPAGTYGVVISMSGRFRKLLPLLIGVPGFDGVRIHTGNTANDTEGCILVGSAKIVAELRGSRLAFAPLYDKINTTLNLGENVEITIEGLPE